MSGSVRNISKKHFITTASAWLDQMSMYRNLDKVRNSMLSLVRTLSPSRQCEGHVEESVTQCTLHAKDLNQEYIDSSHKNINLSKNYPEVSEVTTNCKNKRSDTNTSPGVKHDKTILYSEEKNVKQNDSDPYQSDYYTSYILPVVNRFYDKLPSLRQSEDNASKNADIDTNEENRTCEYEQFDKALRDAGSAQLVHEVIHSTKSLSQKGIVDGINLKLKDITAKAAENTPQPKFTSARAIDARTRGLCIAFKMAKSSASKLVRLEELCQHMRQYPDTQAVACKQNILNIILKTCLESKDKCLQGICNEALAHMGYVPPVKRRGISILSVDGGGTRGVISIEILREIERRTMQPIPDLFDYVVGTSTGALVAILLSVFRLSIDECEQLYKHLSQEVFARSLWGTGRLVWSHAYYDSNVLMKLYKTNMGEKYVIESARDKRCPKLGIVSTAVNLSRLSPYIFRNYNLPSRVQSYYQGTSEYKFWQCLMASCAAPGYFEEYRLGRVILQDGGMLTNNPAGLGLHEATLLWPGVPLQCVVSVGNGRYEDVEAPADLLQEDQEQQPQSISLKSKLTKIVDSATDTEKVHTLLHDLLPPNTYYRLNPYMHEDIMLDEQRTDKLEQLQNDAHMYIRRNDYKFTLLTEKLLQRKPKHIDLLDKLHLAVNTRWT